ncbi:hypothetical protein TNCT_657991 [Trichonephila clavata]|uniref:Uncharacterized protein n=1 Tax=Trichonephila clavata TaxID=2740835 RepID=A0A8X6F5T5_TRICU|nr:hypothetical protein TNCT_657991 [Trichonephila clavata]
MDVTPDEGGEMATSSISPIPSEAKCEVESEECSWLNTFTKNIDLFVELGPKQVANFKFPANEMVENLALHITTKLK